MKIEAALKADESYASEGDIHLILEIVNEADEGIRILKWHTPLEGLITHCLSVTRNGEPVEYDGPLIKRGNPAEEDYLYIGPHETVTHRFEVGSAYKVSLEGDYEVQLKTRLISLSADFAEAGAAAMGGGANLKTSGLEVAQLASPVEKFKVSGEGEPKLTAGEKARMADADRSVMFKAAPQVEAADGGAGGGALPPLFEGGDSNQQQLTTAAHYNGYGLCVTALTEISDNPHYTEWFGIYDSTRAAKVEEVLLAVKTGMETQSRIYNLSGEGCGPSVYAYTFKGGSTVWMCDAFWSAPAMGTDSKAGTVLHEQSHALAGTDDLEYTQPECRRLAIDDPDAAVNNADSYEYFGRG